MSTILLLSSLFNSTTTQENLFISTTTTTSNKPTDAYDHQGAAIYIAIILVWYSTGLAMMLFLQVRPRALQQQYLYDSSRKDRLEKITTNPFKKKYRNIDADNTTKQILNELKDPQRRLRLWKIYYASSEKQNEPDPQYYQTITSDNATINRINRKLADIHRMDSTNDKNLLISSNITSTNDNRSLISTFDSTKFFPKRFPTLRRPPTTNTTTNIRPLFIRAKSQIDEPLSNTTIEMKPRIDRQQLLSSTNYSERNTTPSDRFTIEKVSDNNTMQTIVNKNTFE
ncbi:unnamed protein product [Rotaria sordida]|uniref:Uncharacterized protein n=1 Tax=Rotaria sordida TaxID=392033 RepID=A0A813RD93_9BILA|nr:unnamed protein product [Rotaria sordida]CAF0856054.1 unnamed protein product [Rotaria sordida]